MSFGGFNDNQNNMPMAEINVTPMVDVMLVLLVIFILAAPMFTHSIKLDLPSATAAPSDEKPQTITISVDPAGKLFWNDVAVNRADLPGKLTEAAAKKPQPDIMIRADKNTRYEVVTNLLAAAQTGGLSKVGFVTAPRAK